MANAATRRIAKELKTLNERPIIGISVSPDDANFLFWKGSAKGPPDSPYKGGTFNFTIAFPNDFPFKPPVVTFKTKIYHPGFNEEGHICLAILRDEWKPTVSMSTVLSTIMDKIAKPSPDDPFEADIAAVLKTDEPKFNATAKEWTKKYASS